MAIETLNSLIQQSEAATQKTSEKNQLKAEAKQASTDYVTTLNLSKESDTSRFRESTGIEHGRENAALLGKDLKERVGSLVAWGKKAVGAISDRWKDRGLTILNLSEHPTQAIEKKIEQGEQLGARLEVKATTLAQQQQEIAYIGNSVQRERSVLEAELAARKKYEAEHPKVESAAEKPFEKPSVIEEGEEWSNPYREQDYNNDAEIQQVEAVSAQPQEDVGDSWENRHQDSLRDEDIDEGDARLSREQHEGAHLVYQVLGEAIKKFDIPDIDTERLGHAFIKNELTLQNKKDGLRAITFLKKMPLEQKTKLQIGLAEALLIDDLKSQKEYNIDEFQKPSIFDKPRSVSKPKKNISPIQIKRVA